MKIKNPQANAPVEWLHRVILNIIVTKDIGSKVFENIYSWCETLAYISWEIITSYRCTIIATPGQAVFGRDMVFNFTSVLDWQDINANKKRKVGIDNDQ